MFNDCLDVNNASSWLYVGDAQVPRTDTLSIVDFYWVTVDRIIDSFQMQTTKIFASTMIHYAYSRLVFDEACM